MVRLECKVEGEVVEQVEGLLLMGLVEGACRVRDAVEREEGAGLRGLWEGGKEELVERRPGGGLETDELVGRAAGGCTGGGRVGVGRRGGG